MKESPRNEKRIRKIARYAADPKFADHAAQLDIADAIESLADALKERAVGGRHDIGLTVNGTDVAAYRGPKGDKGDQGKPGPKGDKGDKGDAPSLRAIAAAVIPSLEKLLPSADDIAARIPKPKDGKPGAPGKDGKDGKDGVGLKGDPGKDGSPDTAEDIAAKLNAKVGLLNFSVIRSVPDWATRGDGKRAIHRGGVDRFTALLDTPDAYAGQGGKVVKVNATEDGLEFVAGGTGGTVDSVVAGAGVTVDATDPANPIVATTVTQYTDEMAQDAVGTILADSAEIDFSYNDGLPTISASIVAGSIDESKLDASVNASLDLADSAVQNLAGLGVTASAAELNVLDGVTASTAEINFVDGVTSGIQGQLDAINTTLSQLDAAVVLKGTWDASSGSFPGAGAAQAGWSYIVSVGGTVDGVAFAAGDRAIAIADNASTTTYAANWFKADYTDQVLSVNGQTGAVSLDADDIDDAATSHKFVTAGDLTKLSNLSGTNTGDQDLSGLLVKSANLSDLSNAATARSNLGLAIGTDVQAYDADLASWAGVTRAAGFDTFAATPSSANLRALVSDETGTGALVFADSPTLVTPALGTPSSGSLANCTGLPVSGITSSTSTALGVGSIELGHASDTTLSRSAAGVLAVEGVVIPSVSSTSTLTNKRITKRVGTTTSSATPTINTDNVDMYTLTAQAVAITSFTTNLSGTPTDGQTLWIAITGTAARAITWGSSFEASTVALPTTTVSTNRLDVGFVWNAATSKWRCVAVA